MSNPYIGRVYKYEEELFQVVEEYNSDFLKIKYLKGGDPGTYLVSYSWLEVFAQVFVNWDEELKKV